MYLLNNIGLYILLLVLFSPILSKSSTEEKHRYDKYSLRQIRLF